MENIEIKLSPRLNALLDMIPDCGTVADIGCDHGKLSLAMIQSGKCNRVIAADISKNSLNKTILLAKENNLVDKVQPRLGDGLSVLSPFEADVILIAGVGGENIVQMLKRHPEVARKSVLLLQPMKSQWELREYLYQEDYFIELEQLVFEQSRIYQIVRTSTIGKNSIPPQWPTDFYELGWKLFEQRHPELKRAAQMLYIRFSQKLAEAEINAPGAAAELIKRIRGLEQILKQF